MAMPDELSREIAFSWLAAMESSVRTLDYAGCRQLFAEDVVAFGTRAYAVQRLDRLEHDQWRHIWGTIRNFTFQIDQAAIGGSASAGLIWIAVPWTSEWPDAGGSWQHRPGRMTVILESRGGRWLATHTHHSVAPA